MISMGGIIMKIKKKYILEEHNFIREKMFMSIK